MISLKGKRILVTGGSSGIGRQIAVQAAELGAQVTILGRDRERLSQVLSELEGKGHNCFSFDLTDENELLGFIGMSAAFDGLVFNSGIVEYLPVKFITAQKIKTIFNTNFESTVLLSQQLLKNKLINKKGSLVFISSIAADIGIAGTALYAASKAAVTAYARVMAAELAASKTRVNTICPGIVVTPMTAESLKLSTKDQETQYPLGYGSPEDVSALVMYLLSDVSQWMTGSKLVLDGGYSLYSAR